MLCCSMLKTLLLVKSTLPSQAARETFAFLVDARRGETMTLLSYPDLLAAT